MDMSTSKMLKLDPRLRVLLLLAMVGPALTFVVLPPVLPQMADAFGRRGMVVAQQAQAFLFLGIATGGLLVAPLQKLFGAKPLAVLTAAGYLAGGVGCMLAQTAAPLLAACGGLGLMAALTTSNLLALTGLAMPDPARGRMLGFQTAISDFSTIAGGLLAAAVAQAFGWRAAFILFAGYGAVLLGLCLISPLPKPVRRPPQEQGFDIRVLASLAPIYLAAVGVFILVVSQTTQLPFFLAERGFRSPNERAAVLTSSTITAMIGAVIYGIIRTRWGERHMRQAATVLAFCGFVGLSLWRGQLWVACLCTVGIGGAIGLTVPSLFNRVLRDAPPSHQGAAVGLLNTAIFLGSFLSPQVFTPIAAAGGYRTVFACAAGIAAALGAISLYWRPKNLQPGLWTAIP